VDLGLAGRTVLVTGAGHSIGEWIARGLVAAGARVAVTWRRSRESAEALAAQLDAGAERAMAVHYDLADDASVRAAVAAVAERWGGLDVLVANAFDVPRPPVGGPPFEDVPIDDWRPALRANIEGTILTIQEVARGMRRRQWGRIVVISSNVYKDGSAGGEFYGAAKGALHGMVPSLAWQLGSDGILVNVVSPALTMTEKMLRVLPEPARLLEISRTPTGRLSTMADVANMVVFLCSAANGNTTGEVVHVSGGR
jgi:3-oxoacyl-[acyl-carrier protein] reductase